MNPRLLTNHRLLRAGLVVFLGWAVLEVALINLISARLGWGVTLTILALKGGAGLLLIGYLAVRGLTRVRAALRFGRPAGSQSMAFALASGVLFALPGLVPTLIGLALFAPSLQAALIKRATGGAPRRDPRLIDLPPDQWRETRRRKLASRARSRKAVLEAKPPAV